MPDEPEVLHRPLDAAQGGGPPVLMPWTLVTADWTADLEHGAPLPRVGELIEFIRAPQERHWFRVTRVEHTVQVSASEPSADGEVPGVLRAGLPRVFVQRIRRRRSSPAP